MATRATDELEWFVKEFAKLFSSAKPSGIVGDSAHAARGGYHIGRKFQSSSNYSVTRPDDKGGPDDTASAIDMNLGLADMKTAHVRLRNFWNARDPRMNYVNAWNGWDGNGGAGRYDVVRHDIQGATSDHKWHIHLEFRRRYCENMTAMRAVLSMLKGESLATWQGTAGTDTPVSKPQTPTKPAPKPVVVENKAPSFPLAANKYFTKSDKFNANVKIFQRRLQQRGWDLGKAGADGYFGARTLDVVKQFQKEKHLGVDGLVGPKTWKAIWEAPVTK